MVREDTHGSNTPGSIRVCVRARPLLPGERDRGETEILNCKDPKNIDVVLPTSAGVGAPQTAGAGQQRMTTTLSRAFQFDLVCHEGFSQDAVFSHSGAAHFVDAALEGVKATIMAYGATSSGKTYTMSGLDEASPGGRDNARDAGGTGGDVDAHEGLIIKSARHLYASIAARESSVEVTASYCEVYNEHVFDLLNLTGRPLAPRHQPEVNEFFVPGLLEVPTPGPYVFSHIVLGLVHKPKCSF